MLMKIEHGNLRTAPAPLPRVARATSPTRWATCPAEDRDRQTGVPARPLGLGPVEYNLPLFSPVPGKSQTGKCAMVRCGATSFCFLPPWIFLWSKNNPCSHSSYRSHSPNPRLLKKIVLPLPHHRLQSLLELFHQLVMRGGGFGIGQGSFGIPVSERVGQALLAGRHVFAAEDIEEFHAFKVRRLCVFH